MKCYYCDNMIENEFVAIDFGIYGKLEFCNNKCKNDFIEERTIDCVLNKEE